MQQPRKIRHRASVLPTSLPERPTMLGEPLSRHLGGPLRGSARRAVPPPTGTTWATGRGHRDSTAWIVPDEEREHPDCLAAHVGLDEDKAEATVSGGVEPTPELIEAR
jgi:hypothetical protein